MCGPTLPDPTIAAVPSEAEEFEPRRPSVWKALLRTGIGVALISILLWRTDLGSIGRALAEAPLGRILLGTLFMLGLVVVSGFRWRVFLRRLEVHLSIPTTIRLTFVGSFFNAFLPTGVGGDAYKALRLRSPDTSLSTAFASVLLDRITGIEALAALGLAAVVLGSESGAVTVVAAAVGLSVLVVGVLLLLVGDAILGRGPSRWFGLRPPLRRTLRAVVMAARDPRTIGWGMLGGFVAQLFGLAAHGSMAWALGLNVPLTVLTLGLLIATVAASAPVTVNGVGVREAAWVWILGSYGIGSGRALAFALLVLAMNLAASAIGGIVYAVAGGDVKRSG